MSRAHRQGTSPDHPAQQLKAAQAIILDYRTTPTDPKVEPRRAAYIISAIIMLLAALLIAIPITIFSTIALINVIASQTQYQWITVISIFPIGFCLLFINWMLLSQAFFCFKTALSMPRDND